MLSQNAVWTRLAIYLPVVAGLMLFLTGCSLFESAEQTEGSFQATITGTIESQMVGSASYMQMNCASIALQSEKDTLVFDDFCSTTSQGPKEGEYPIRENVLDSSDSTGFTAVYQPDESSGGGPVYRGITGTLVLTEVDNDITHGHFTLDAKPRSEGSQLNGNDSRLIQIEGDFQAVAREARD